MAFLKLSARNVIEEGTPEALLRRAAHEPTKQSLSKIL